MARRDPHSYADDTQVATESLALKARVDFARRVLHAEATLAFAAPGGGPLDLDTRDLAIDAVEALDGRALPFALHTAEPILGARLAIELPAGSTGVRIRYRTSPVASALQWLEPAQTAGGRSPFLFSQCQVIHARSVVPLQDTPRLRIRYRAELTVPRALTAVMAAAHRGRSEDGDVASDVDERTRPVARRVFERGLQPQPSHTRTPAVVERRQLHPVRNRRNARATRDQGPTVRCARPTPVTGPSVYDHFRQGDLTI